MRILLLGYGRMGRLIETAARERGHEITARVDPYDPEADAIDLADVKNLTEAELAIEFTRPDTAVANIKALAALGLSIVAGTTGWHDALAEASAAVAAARVNLMYAANFSLGVNLFYRIAAYAARLFDRFSEYDVGGWEFHHDKKADSPSGTAKHLAESLLRTMKRKTTVVYDKLDRPPAPEELHFSSLRVGSFPGTHGLVFDSSADSVELVHTARGREGFARGAIWAAEWLSSRPLSGAVYTMDDALVDLLGDLA